MIREPHSHPADTYATIAASATSLAKAFEPIARVCREASQSFAFFNLLEAAVAIEEHRRGPAIGRKRRARRARGRRRLARCSGAGWDECADCQRRTLPGGRTRINPPAFVALWCENYIPPDRPQDQRLREMARLQRGVGS